MVKTVMSENNCTVCSRPHEEHSEEEKKECIEEIQVFAENGGDSSTSVDESPAEKHSQASSETGINDDEEQEGGVEPPKPDGFAFANRAYTVESFKWITQNRKYEDAEPLFSAETIQKEIQRFINTNQEVAEADYGERSEKAEAVVNELKELEEVFSNDKE